VGRIHANPHHATYGTWHGDAMLTLVVDGRGFYQKDGNEGAVVAGMVGLVLPEGSPGWLRADTEDPYTHYYCRFAGAEALAMATRIRRGMSASFQYWDAWEEGARILEQMLAWGLRDTGDSEAEESWMNPAEGLLAHLLARLCETPARPRAPRLSAERLHRYLVDRLNEPLSLEDMARHFAVSKAHLCREARRLLGETVLHAAQRGKMEWALRLLSDPNLRLSVSEAAFRLGYADPLYFSKVFKRHHGFSPKFVRNAS